MPAPDLVGLFVVPLNRTGITYMVTGALAAGMYGEVRLTNDIDLVVKLKAGDSGRLRTAFDESAFYVPPLEVMELEASRPLHGHFNLIHHETALRADIYVAGTDPLHEWALGRRERIRVEAEDLWLAPAEYVIVRKLQYLRAGASDKHIRDVRAMLVLMGDRLDRETLLGHIDRLRLRAEWERME